jgi:hypothetical protein
MRILLTLLVSTLLLRSEAQKYVPLDPMIGLSPALSFTPYTFGPEVGQVRHWQVRPFTTFSGGYVFSTRGYANYLSAQTGWMLLRPLNNNISAFAGISAGPTLYRIGSTPFSNNIGGLNLTAGVTGGLIYTNDARTFSISGSVSVERYSYPAYAPARATYPSSTYP